MKYLCLVYAQEDKVHAVPDRDCLAYDAALRERGQCLASEALEPVETATTVRVRNGKVTITDGPFAETKEQLTGFYLIEAEDLDAAIRIAAKIPPARVGSIEVRPIRPIRETAARAGTPQSTPLPNDQGDFR
ncbi:MAG: YciI family protein [bacterium]